MTETTFGMHQHQHSANANTGRFLGLSLFLTLAFVVGELVAGYFANSLALLSDAAHNFADALALGFSWFALRLAQRPADARRTFGSHRAGILVALANAVSLVVLALIIGWEALMRMRAAPEVQSGLMIGVALAAVILNGVISWWLRHGAQHDLNIRSAYLHMLGDALSAFGVVVAGVIVALTRFEAADAIASLVIAVLILWSSWGILVEAVNVLMEAVPRGLDMAQLEAALRQVGGVRDFHDLHVWTVGSGIVACSCHVIVDEQSIRAGQQVLRAVAEVLEHRFGITHATIQIEVEGCDPNDMYCTLRKTAHDHAGHAP